MSQIETFMQSLLTDTVLSMQAYHVPDAAKMIKLDAMENPHQWSQELKQQWLARLQEAEINRYPNADAKQLRQKISTVMQLPSGLDVMLGNGSDELIQVLAMALNRENASMFAVEPSFVMYKVTANILSMPYFSVPLNADFSLNVEAVLAGIKLHQPALLFFAVPNNPTGNCFSEEQLRAIIEASSGLVIIDEAYIAFTETTMLQLAVDYDNVLIMRTFSKVGLAGLRLGMLIGKAAWIEQFNKIRMPYNVNVLTQLSVEFALDHYDVLLEQAEMLKAQRRVLLQQLVDLPRVTVFPSAANFILLRTEKPAAEIFEALKAQGILIKCLANAHPLLSNCLRITVSTEAENTQFFTAFKALV